MYAVIGGINLDPDKPGYKHILMRSHPGGGLTSARAELQSMYGTIRRSWSWENDRFKWDIMVPANTTATVYIPAKDEFGFTENGKAMQSAEGITFLRMEDGCAVFTVTAGSYTFSSVIEREIAGSK